MYRLLLIDNVQYLWALLGSFFWHFVTIVTFQDVYPKGVIPLAAIQMSRPAKDTKFEIVTSHRIFVFKAENEGIWSQ